MRQNPLVVYNPLDFGALQEGGYVVKPADAPFYQITRCDERTNEICLHQLKPGDVTRHDLLSVTPALW